MVVPLVYLVVDRAAYVLSVSPHLFSPLLLVAVVVWVAPCRPSSRGLDPTRLCAAASLSPVPSLSAFAPFLCDRAPALCLCAALAGRAHVPDPCSDKEEVLLCTAL